MTDPGTRRPSGRALAGPVAATLAVAALAAALAAGATGARTASPAQYRAHLNGVCRGYSARFKTVQKVADKAMTAGNAKAYFSALGRYLSLQLAEDRVIEKAAPPAAIRGLVKRAQRLLVKADAALRSGKPAVAKHNQAGVNRLVQKANALTPGINKALDAAGLRDCGSNQS